MLTPSIQRCGVVISFRSMPTGKERAAVLSLIYALVTSQHIDDYITSSILGTANHHTSEEL
jgi:hypothetical protein